MATFHLYDHLKAAGHSDAWATLRAARPAEFEVLQAVCNGTKHARETGLAFASLPATSATNSPRHH